MSRTRSCRVMLTCALGLGFLTACEVARVGNVAVTGVSLDRHTLSMTVGSANETLVATVTPASATNPNLRWVSSQPSVATVTPTGVVTPIGEGDATITVAAGDGGITDTCAVSVSPPVAVTGVALSQETLNLTVNWVAETLVATVLPANATNKNVSWSSSDTRVATVTQEGVVSPQAIGTTSVVATTEDGGFSSACDVSVGAPVAVTGVSLDRDTLSLVVGSPAPPLVATVEPWNATNRNLGWSSSDTSVVTVSQSGQVSALAEGVATITATTEDGKFQATCEVAATDTVGWVMSYFGSQQDVEADSLHLAYSTDGLHWTAVIEGAAYYQVAGIGKNHIREPFIMRKVDGTFIYLATDWTRDEYSDYWSNPSPNIFVADSVDLITFTNPRLLRVTDLEGPDKSPMLARAPEAYWDSDREKYAILWSGNDENDVHRIYVSYTSDFVTVDSVTPEVFFYPGYSVIDATVLEGNGRNYLLFKDETDNSDGSGQDIQIARSPGVALDPQSFVRWDSGYLTRGGEQLVRQWTEGPFVIKVPDTDRWYMYADRSQESGVLGCWTTTDLDSAPSQWTPLSNTAFSLPADLKQASAFRVTRAELDRLRLTGITVNVLLAVTSEIGWNATFTVRLDRQPVGQVQVHFGSTDTGEGIPDRTSLTFTDANWDVEQTVTVTGVDDSLDDGPQSYEITFTAQTGGDPAYNALPPPSPIPLTNYDDERPVRIKSTYAPNGKATYLAHARYYVDEGLGEPAYHAVVTTLDDGSLQASDFYWYLVPGLVQGDTDANLVSLAPVNLTDCYLRLDSVNPERWPPCKELSTTAGRCDSGTSDGCLCVWWDGLDAESNRRYLGWLDLVEDSTTYRSDATFHLDPALNGETDLVSLRWHNSSQYVRHASYQVVAWTIGSDFLEEASFVLDQLEM